jgi:D-3-phosphoglycerate dehydrogenase
MKSANVLITEDLQGSALETLREKYEVVQEADLWQDGAALRERVAAAHALMVRNRTPVTEELLDAAPWLQVVGRAGVGLDNVDVDAASARGIVVCYAPEENAISVAEHVFALTLALARNLLSADRTTKSGQWERHGHTGWELYGKTLGLLGLGKIGVRVALRARAFGMEVGAFDPYLSPNSWAVTESGAKLASLDEVLARADVLSIHLPLTEETRRMLDYLQFCAMKPTAVVINTSRGGVLSEAGLYQALTEGRLAGAALDVREPEPPGDSPLHALPNVLVTPHIAAFTVEGQERVMAAVVRDVDRVLSGAAAINYANFPRPRRRL